jgi:signal peptidase
MTDFPSPGPEPRPIVPRDSSSRELEQVQATVQALQGAASLLQGAMHQRQELMSEMRTAEQSLSQLQQTRIQAEQALVNATTQLERAAREVEQVRAEQSGVVAEFDKLVQGALARRTALVSEIAALERQRDTLAQSAPTSPARQPSAMPPEPAPPAAVTPSAEPEAHPATAAPLPTWAPPEPAPFPTWASLEPAPSGATWGSPVALPDNTALAPWTPSAEAEPQANPAPFAPWAPRVVRPEYTPLAAWTTPIEATPQAALAQAHVPEPAMPQAALAMPLAEPPTPQAEPPEQAPPPGWADAQLLRRLELSPAADALREPIQAAGPIFASEPIFAAERVSAAKPIFASEPVVAAETLHVVAAPAPARVSHRFRGLGLREVATALIATMLVGLAVLLTPVTQVFGGMQLLAVMSGSMEPTIQVGGIVAVRPAPVSALQVGDVITFTNQSNPEVLITHRIVSHETRDSQTLVTTKGDANDSVDAVAVTANRAVGRVDFTLPWLGYLMVWLASPLAKVGILVISVIGFALPSTRRKPEAGGEEAAPRPSAPYATFEREIEALLPRAS